MEFPQGDYFRQAFIVTRDIDIKALREQGFENMKLANKIKQVRTDAVAELKETYK
jgi:hypothetical protein